MEIIKNKKKFRRLIVAFYLLVFLVLFAVLVRDTQETSAAWYNSSWLYRKPVTITGDGSSYTNHDVLVTIDSASLITGGKLQADCDDLRFTDSDEITLIDYWVEGGCNTSSTQVWVQIPSMPTSNKTLYVYYGNSSATNAELNWTGNFYLFSNEASCGTGWTADTNFNSKYVYGSTSAGLTKPGSHFHNKTNVTTGSTYNTVDFWSDRSMDYCGQTLTIENHTHTFDITLSTHTNLPRYYNALICYSNNLVIDNKIAIFDTTVPTNWTKFNDADGKLLRGYSSAGSIGGSYSHGHSVSAFTPVGSNYDQPWQWGDVDCYVNNVSPPPEYNDNHGHTAGGVSGYSKVVYPPSIYVIYGKSNGAQSPESGMIAGSSSVPPLGWSSQSSINSDKLLYGTSSFGSTFGSSSHSHTIGGTTSTPTSSISGEASVGTMYTRPSTSHTHQISTASSWSNSWPDSRSLLFIQRQTSLTTTVGVEQMSNSSPSAPTSLLTEGLTNPTNVSDLTPEFSATFNDPDTGDTATNYEIEVNTLSDFTGTVMWDSNKTSMASCTEGTRCSDISYGQTNLTADGSLYYWRIRFWDDGDAVSPWSATASFRMQSAPSTPTDPLVDGQTNPIFLETLTPTFSAIYNDINEHKATAYEIEVNSNNTFTGTVVWDTGKLTTTVTDGTRSPDYTYAGTPLSNSGTTYYWRIRFWDIDDLSGGWSSTGSFVDALNSQYFEGIQMEGIRVD